MPHSASWSVVAACAAATLSGCAASTDGEATSGVKLPTLPSVADLTPAAPESPVGSATELYARIARGANACWFAANGPLKKAYIYHAEADAPSRGGKAEITIHERAPGQPNPRGAKAYRVNIEPEGASAKVVAVNLKMDEVSASAMAADVDRWSKGEQGCTNATTAAGWGPRPVEDEKPKSSGKKQSAAKAKPAAR